MKLTRRDFTAGLAAGITAPYVIGSARAQGATIKIGMCVPVTGPGGRAGALGAERRQARARRGQQGRRRARQAGRTRHRGRPDHQSRHRAGVLQAGRAVRHRRLPRLDPLDPGACDGARRAQARQAGDDRRHRSRAHPHGQPVAVPLPPQRQLFRPRHRRLRRQHARQEEMGDRAFDRRVRHRRRQGAGRRRWKSSAPRRCSIRAMPTRARISRRSCWR